MGNMYDMLRSRSAKVTGSLIRIRSETFRDANVPGKYKLLAALSISVAIRCEPCINGYTKLAFQAGATEAELIEFLNVAITESGCPGEQWAMIALEIYERLQAGDNVSTDICCQE